jgi:hypothetical protein
MKKPVFLFIGILLTLILVCWEYWLGEKILGFNNIADWGSYFLIVPMIFPMHCFLNPDSINLFNAITMVCLGAIVTRLMSTDLSTNFCFPKICATITGGVVTWFVVKRLD